MSAWHRTAAAPIMVAVLCAAALGATRTGTPAPPQAVSDAERLLVSAEERRAGLAFAPDVREADREWVRAAIRDARPEARALIAEVDGLVDLRVHTGATPGFMRDEGGERLIVSLDPDALIAQGTYLRRHAVLHELGHVVDRAMLAPAVVEDLERGIPDSDLCLGGPRTGSCAEPAERLADTFAKWAVRSPGYRMTVGYHVPAPTDLDAWGAPLARLAATLSR